MAQENWRVYARRSPKTGNTIRHWRGPFVKCYFANGALLFPVNFSLARKPWLAGVSPRKDLTLADGSCILICMRTTLIINDDILKRAVELTGTHEKTALIHAGLEALIEKKARERLAALGGTAPRFRAGRRR